MTLDDLTAEEQRLLALVRSAEGLMEKKARQLEELGVYDAYAVVHQKYVKLAVSEQDLEALKRAMFLQWYALSEPPCFTGISEPSESARRAVLEQLEHLAGKDGLDEELSWMLPWYYRITDYFFEGFRDLPNLKRYLKSSTVKLPTPDMLGKESLLNRGQMGAYWLSVLESNSGRQA